MGKSGNSDNSDIRLVVDVDYQPTYEKFKETLTKIADAVEKELPKIKLDFDSKSVKEAESGTEGIADSVKEIGDAAKKASANVEGVADAVKKAETGTKDVVKSIKAAGREAGATVETLSEDADKFNTRSAKLSKQLETMYEQMRKFKGASMGGDAARKAYTNLELAKRGFENLETAMEFLSASEFDGKFRQLDADAKGATEELARLDEKTKLLTRDSTEYGDALAKVNKLRSIIEKNSARWTASQNGTTSAEYNAYSALAGDGAGSTGELIKKLETGEMKMNDFAKAFSEVNAKASEYSRIISKAGEDTKVANNSLLVRGTDEYNAALDKIKSRLADVKRYTEAWTAAREGKSSEAYAELTKQADALYALNSRLSEGTVYNNEYKETMAGITTVIGESVLKIREANEDMKASSPSELTEGTRAYANALKQVEDLSRKIQNNSEAWTKAEDGKAKEAYATYKNLGTELDTLYKCIQTNQLTGEEFEEWFARIGTTATNSARAIRQANEDMKVGKTLAPETKEYNDALAKANKLLVEVTNNTKKWSKASEGKSREAYDKYKSQIEPLTKLIEKLKTGKAVDEEFNKEYEKTRTVMKDSEATIRANGDAVSKFGGVLVEVGMKLYYYYFGLQKMIQLAKKMISTSIEVESAMNRLQIVTGATDYEMKNFFSAAAEQAKELGKNIVDVASSIETFSRLGYTLSESSTLSKFATIMSNIADTDVSKATTGLTSIIKGYKLDVSNVEHVTDVLVQVGKKYAISAEELMEAFERGGAALNASGTSFEKSAALFAATNASLQNAANVGTLWKTVSARIRGSKTELEELGESYDDLADGFSKYRDEILALSGVDIMVDKNHFKDIYDIFVELAQVWDKIDSDTAKARISEILGGTRQLSGIASTINNISDAIGAYNDAVADETAGVALKANEKYMETTAAHIEQLKTSFQELSYDAFNSDFLKFFVDRLKDIVEAIDWLTKHIGTLGTALLGLSAVKFFKNFGNLREVVKYMGLLKGVTAEASRGFSSLASAIGISSATLGAFIAVAGGIFVIVKIIDALTESYEEAKEKYESAKQNLESTQEEISNVNSELENTKKRLQELEGKHLTAVEQAEYNRLVLYNEQLERQKQILSDNEKIQKNALAVAANNALTNNGFRVYDKEIAARANEINKSLNGYDARALSQLNPYRSGDIIEMIEGETEEIKALEAAGEENSNRYSELISSRAKHISEAIEYSNNLIGSDGEVLDEYKKTWERLFNALDNTKSDEQKAEEKAKKQTDTIKSILEKYTGLAKTIKQLVRDNPFGITANDLLNSEDLKNGGLLDAIFGSGYSLTAFAEHINASESAVAEKTVDDAIKKIISSATVNGIGWRKAFDEFKKYSAGNQVAIFDALDGIDVSSWSFGDFTEFFKDVTKDLINGKTYVELATENFETLNDNFVNIKTESERYISMLEKIQSFNRGTGNSISTDSFFSSAAVRSINEQIEALSHEDTKEAAEKIAKLREELASLMDMKDYSVALEYHNGTLTYNLDLVDKITEAKKKELLATNDLNKSLARDDYLNNAAKIRSLRKEIENTTNAEVKLNKEKELEQLLAQNSDLANEITHYDLMANSIKEATDAYHDWINAQKATESGEMFEGAVGAIKKIDEILNDSTSDVYGRVGRTDYKAAVKFVIPETIDQEDEEAVNKYLESISKYFTTDSNSKVKGLNIDQFLNDAVKAGLMTVDESGEDFRIAGTRTMQEFADGLGLALPFVQSIFGLLEEYGAKFDWSDEAGKSLADLKVEANEAAEALMNLGKLGKFDIGFNAEDTVGAISEINGKIKELQELKAMPEIDPSSIEYANRIIEYLVRQRQELQQPLIMSVDSSEVDKKYSEFVSTLQEFQKQKDDLDLQVELGFDEGTINASNARLDELATKISGMNTELNLGIDDTSKEGIEAYIAEIQEEKLIDFGIDRTQIKKFKDEKLEKDNAAVKWGNDLSAINNFISVPLVKTAMVQWQSDTSRVSTPAQTNNGSLPAWSKVNGTANAGGNWGNKHAGRTLVGEAGEEIIVNPHTGRWYTVGSNGAEFVYLPKDAIVFNHKQTKSLLENGSINSRGRSMASGNAMVTGVIRRPNFSPSDEKKEEKQAKETQEAVQQAAQATTQAATDTTQSVIDIGNDVTETIDDKTDTILDKFKEWLGTLFDWIEVRISRLTDGIEKTVASAERSLNNGRYGSAASKYSSAIEKTVALIENEQAANSRYAVQAERVMQQAISRGLISQGQAASIRSLDASGTIDIMEYDERIREVIGDYQQWMDKARDASSAIGELHDKIRNYTESLKKVRDAQRDAKIEASEFALSIGNGGNANSYYYQNKQLKYSSTNIKRQSNAYSSAVKGSNKDMNTARSNAVSSVNASISANKGNVTYIKVLERAKKLMSSGKKIPASILNAISKKNLAVYERLFAYNLALDNLEVAKAENALNYSEFSSSRFNNIAKKYENLDSKANDKISLFGKKSENAGNVATANKYLSSSARQYKKILSNDKSEYNKYKSLTDKNRKAIYGSRGLTGKGDSKAASNAVKSAKAAVKGRKYISPSVLAAIGKYYKKGYISEGFYKACIDYNNAHDRELQAKEQYEIDKQTTKASLAEIGSQKLQNVQNAYDRKQERLAAKRSLLSEKQEQKTKKGLSLTRGDYSSMITSTRNERSLLQQERKALANTIKSNLANGLWTKKSKEYKEAKIKLLELDNSIAKTISDEIDLNNAIAQIPYDTIEKAIEKFDALEKQLDSSASLKKATGSDLSKSDYTKRINTNSKMISKYQKEREQARKDYLKAKASKDGAYGGKTADEWLVIYRNLGTTINGLLEDNEKLKDSLRDDVYWREFERAHAKAKRFREVISGIVDLLDDDMYFNKDGMLTQYGVTKIAELTKQYELARTEVENYTNDIQNLIKLWNTYPEETAKEMLADMQSGLLDSAKSMKTYLDSIKDMYKAIDQEELNRLFKLIDLRSEALAKKKSYYDFDKTIREKTKDVRSLESQIAALEGVSTSEAKGKRAKLRAQLAEAQEALEETQRDHELQLSKEGLDGLKTTLQEEFDNKWDNIGQDLDALQQLLSTANSLTAENTATINDTLNSLLSFYGIDTGSTRISKKYASGTRAVKGTHVALSNEAGSEILVTKHGLISRFNPGDGVVPADMTERLYTLAQSIKPGSRFGGGRIHGLRGGNGSVDVTQNYGSLINIEGSADAATVEDLKRLSSSLLEKSYNYTSRRITQDYVKTGGRRVL